MGNITEAVQWDENIYQIETTDPVLGGANGIANKQAKSLGNRTQFLKTLFGNLTGMVIPFAGSVAPAGFLFCAGQIVNRADYPALFAVIGTTYNTSGETTAQFRLPDLRGRAVAGVDNMNGTAANRLTTASGGVNAAVLGAAGGASTHTLTVAQMPAHAHGVTDPTHAHSVADPGHTHSVYDPGHAHTYERVTTTNGQGSDVGVANDHNTGTTSASATGISLYAAATGIGIYGAATGISVQNNGGGGAHPIVQPTISLNYIIKA